MQGIEILNTPPSAEEFISLRAAAGLPERKISSAEKGLANSLFWITLRKDRKLIAMGRVVGDGGTVAQVTDIAVHPEHRNKGYGTLIFDQIQKFILIHIPDDAFVCLFAQEEMKDLYHSKGFTFSEGKWPGMYWPCLERTKAKNTR